MFSVSFVIRACGKEVLINRTTLKGGGALIRKGRLLKRGR